MSIKIQVNNKSLRGFRSVSVEVGTPGSRGLYPSAAPTGVVIIRAIRDGSMEPSAEGFSHASASDGHVEGVTLVVQIKNPGGKTAHEISASDAYLASWTLRESSVAGAQPFEEWVFYAA